MVTFNYVRYFGRHVKRQQQINKAHKKYAKELKEKK